MKRAVLLVAFVLVCLASFSQNYWDDPSTFPKNNIPDDKTKVIWEANQLIVPAGFNAECKNLDLINNSTNPPAIIIYGTLTVHNQISLEVNENGIGNKNVIITIAPGGKLIFLGKKINIEGNSVFDDRRVIDVQGTFDLYDELNLTGKKGGVSVGTTLKIADEGILNLFKSNGYKGADLLTIGSKGKLVYGDNARINFCATSGDQNFNDNFIWPHVAVTGGGVLYLKSAITNNNLLGDLIAENGTIDVEGNVVSGNQNNQIKVASLGVFRIGGTQTFPASTGSTNTFSAPELSHGSTVVYDGENNQDIEGLNYWNLTLQDGDGGSNAIKSTINQPKVSGVLSIKDDVVLNVSNSSLTLVSTGEAIDETGMIGFVSGFIVGDSVIVQRKIDLTTSSGSRVGWNDWCSPIVNNTLKSWCNSGVYTSGFSGSNAPSSRFTSVYAYDANTISTSKNDGFVKATNINNNTGLGSGVRFYGGNFRITISDTGQVHVGDLKVDLPYKDIQNSPEEGWSLLGNPYACAIDWDAIVSDGVTGNIENAFWLYSNEIGYYTYNGVTGVGNGIWKVQDTPVNTSLIASNKAFWVKANDAGASITFKESHKNTGGAIFLKSGNINQNRELIRLQIESDLNAYKSAAVLALDENASQSIDPFDSQFVDNPMEDAPGIGFVIETGEVLSINTLPITASFLEIPLHVSVGISGTYRLRFFDVEQLGTAHCIRLLDTENNASYNIRENPVVEVDMTTTTPANRFTLVFGSPMQSQKINDVSSLELNDGQLLIDASTNKDISAFNIYHDNNLIYENLQHQELLSHLKVGEYKITTTDANNYCEGAYAKVVINQLADVSFSKVEDRSMSLKGADTKEKPYTVINSENQFKISWVGEKEEKLVIDILNINGQTINKGEYLVKKGELIQVDNSTWSQGVYVVNVIGDNQYFTEKLIVN